MFYLFIGVGAFLGATARYFLSTFIIKAVFLGFPLGTFFVNVLGCYLIGVLSAIHISNKEFATPFLAIGFLGYFTTVSAFTKEILFFSKFIWITIYIKLFSQIPVFGGSKYKKCFGVKFLVKIKR